jgi:DNA-binding MarR family transcriptional regulator
MAHFVSGVDGRSPSNVVPINSRPAILDAPGYVLGAADRVSSALWRDLIEPVVTQPQYLALSELFFSPGISQYELADSVGIDRVTIGPVIKRFEALNLVHRQRDARDGRRSILDLLAPGVALLERAAPLVDKMTQEFMSPLTSTEQAVVVQSWAMLGQVGQAIDQRHTGRRSGGTHIRPPAHFPWLFLRLARRSYRRIWREQASDVVTPSQFALMSLVNLNDGIDIRTAAERSLVEESTAVRIVMRSARLRLLRDTRDDQDARRTLIHLTDEGRKALKAISEKLNDVENAFSARIPPQAYSEFYRSTRLVARLGNASPGRNSTVGQRA